MGPIRIQVDARHVALFGSAQAIFMALEEEMRPILVAWVGSVLSREDQVGILIGLGLRGLHLMARSLDVAWRWHHGSVTVIAIKGDVGGAIFQSCRALGHDQLPQLGWQDRGDRYPHEFGIGL